jgi:uncharacterized CHY-type Zn-finger protein
MRKSMIVRTCITTQGQIVYGLQLNACTGCLHYSSALDVIAIKFKCCKHYYACYSCHLEIADHPAERWQDEDCHEKAVLCGRCGVEMTIQQYLCCNNECINCQARFNPGCKLHWELYFKRSCINNH